MGRKWTYLATVFQRTQQQVSSSPHTNLWNVFHLTQPVLRITNRYLKNGKLVVCLEIGLWTVFIDSGLRNKKWKKTQPQTHSIGIWIYSKKQKSYWCWAVVKTHLPLTCVRDKQFLSKPQRRQTIKSPSKKTSLIEQ